ncbi:MAG: outer membrane beta-barrel family protein [Odoribacter splanchnicus]
MKILCILFLLWMGGLTVSAQITIKGDIADSLGKTLEGPCTVMVVNQKDFMNVCGGEIPRYRFELTFQKIEGEKYWLYVFLFGYEPKMIDITAKAGDLGTILLKPLSHQLEEAVVKQKRIQHEIVDGDDIFKIAGTEFSKEFSLYTLLGRLPGLYVNDEQVVIIGTGAPIFTINGLKPRPGELRTIHPDQIDQIMINRTPSAKYSQSVLGIIDIKLKKSLKDFASAYVTDNFTVNNVNRNNIISVDLNTKSGPWFNYLSYSYTYDKNECDIRSDVETALEQDTITVSTYENETYKKNQGHTFIYSPKYQLADESFVDVQYNLDISRKPYHLTNIGTRKSTSGEIEEDIYQENRGKNSNTHHYLNLRYTTMLTKKSQMVVNGGYTNMRNVGEQSIDETINQENEQFIQDSRFKSQVYFGDIEYNALTFKKLLLNAGLDYSYIRNRTSSIYNRDIEAENSQFTRIKDQKGVGYLNLTYKGKKIVYSAGVRGEYNQRDDFFNEKNDYHQFVWNPVATINYKISKQISMKGGYRRAVLLPGVSMLNPVATYINKYLYVSGNPDLKRGLSHNLTYRLNLPWHIAFDAKYVFARNSISKVVTADENNPEVSKYTYVNIKKGSTMKGTLSYYGSWGFYTLMCSATYVQNFLNIPYRDSNIHYNHPNFGFFIQNDFRIMKGLILTITGNYSSKSKTFPTESSGTYAVNASLTYNLKNFHVFILGQNLLYNIPDLESRYVNIYKYQYEDLHDRSFRIGISYNFNKFKNIFQKNEAGGEAIQRAQ